VTEFGRLFQRLRSRHGISQEEVAFRAGVSIRTVGAVERGEGGTPRRSTVEALVEALGPTDSERSALMEASRQRGEHAPVWSARAGLAPHRLHDFVGREGELASVLSGSHRPDAPRVVIIAGAGGAGKTSLAVQAASREPAEWPRFFVDLNGLGVNPLSAPQALTSLLLQSGTLADAPTSPEEASRLWREYTASQAGIVVILDAAADADDLAEIMRSTVRGLLIITTRRLPERVTSAAVVQLGALPDEMARDLLRSMIPAHRRDEDSIARLAELTGGMPLALRIVGNRINARAYENAQRVADRLESEGRRLRELTAGDLSVELAFTSSYTDLPAALRRTFARLGVIEGSTFDVAIAAAAAGATLPAIHTQLEDLRRLALVEPRGDGRYRLHDLLRIFARARLREDYGQAAVSEAADRLHHWLVSALSAAGAWFEPGRDPREALPGSRRFSDQGAAKAWLVDEADHWWPAYQALAARGLHAEVIDAADALHWFSDLWIGWGHWQEFFERSAAAALSLENDRETARHLGYLAWTYLVERGDFETAYEVSCRALAAADDADDDEQRGWAEFYRAWSLHWLDRLDPAAVAAARAAALLRAAGDHDGYFSAVHQTATIHRGRGDLDSAERALRDALTSVRRDRSVEDTANRARAQASVMDSLAGIQLTVRKPLDALATAEEALGVAQLHDLSLWEAISRIRLAEAHRDLGDMRAAADQSSLALELLAEDPSAVAKRFRAEATAVLHTAARM
jgi:transcriptional regulator with XRE-family HTH domain